MKILKYLKIFYIISPPFFVSVNYENYIFCRFNLKKFSIIVFVIKYVCENVTAISRTYKNLPLYIFSIHCYDNNE